jgi:hypothetical protein
MQGPLNDLTCSNIISSTQRTARRKVFALTMKGVASAAITKRRFISGAVDKEGLVYRRFYYNENGDVTKRISFNQDGNIELKEESEYNAEGKLVSSKFITGDNIVREEYTYSDDGLLLRYTLINPKSGGIKYETNQFDNKGRLLKTTSYGLMGAPEYISYYIYPAETGENYMFKQVTKADGSLLLTFYFTYDSDRERGNLTGVYGYFLAPDEILSLLENEQDTEWESRSLFRSVWEYQNGKPVSFFRDEKVQKFHFDFGYTKNDERILTDRSSMEYQTIRRKNYLVRIVEWQTRFLEPLKEVKEYTYYDEDNNQIFPPDEELQTATAKKRK